MKSFVALATLATTAFAQVPPNTGHIVSTAVSESTLLYSEQQGCFTRRKAPYVSLS